MIRNGVISKQVSIPDLQTALSTDESTFGLLCTHANINPMAKYKPVRYNKTQPLTEAERYGVRYGLDRNIPSFSTGSPNNKAVWTYSKPQGGASDPFRASDFLKDDTTEDVGYDVNACAPFAFGVEGASIDSDSVEGNGGVGFPIYVNVGVNAYYANNGSISMWHEDRSLSILELLNSESREEYLGFAIYDLGTEDNPTGANAEARVIVSCKKLRELSSSVETIFLTSIDKTLTGSGKFYPGVDFFRDARRAGHTFRFVAFLYNNFTAPSNYAYMLLPNSVDVHSLAFTDGIDRHDVVVNLRNTVTGIECSLISGGLTLSYVGSSVISGYTYYQYRCSGTVTGKIVTPSKWANDGVRVKVVIRTDTGYPGSVTSPSNYESSTWVSITPGAHTFQGTLATPSGFNVYFPSQVSVSSRSVSVSAVAYGEAQIESEKVTFDNSFSVNATS